MGPRLVSTHPAATLRLGDKLQVLAHESPNDLKDLERLIDWKLAQLHPLAPPPKKPDDRK